MGCANLFYHMIFITIYVVYIKSYKFYKNQITITLAFELIIVALLPYEYLLLSNPLISFLLLIMIRVVGTLYP